MEDILKKSCKQVHTFSVGRICQCLVTMVFLMIVLAVCIPSGTAGAVSREIETDAAQSPAAVETVHAVTLRKSSKAEVRFTCIAHVNAGEAKEENRPACTDERQGKEIAEAVLEARNSSITGTYVNVSDPETARNTAEASDTACNDAEDARQADASDENDTDISDSIEEARETDISDDLDQSAVQNGAVLCSASVSAVSGCDVTAVISQNAVSENDVLAIAALAAADVAGTSSVSADNADITDNAAAITPSAAIPEPQTDLSAEEPVSDAVSETDVNAAASAASVPDSVSDVSIVQSDLSETANAGISPDDYSALCRIVQAEAGNESQEGKLLVANVIMNRVANPSFPNSIQGVITQSGQFTPVSNGAYSSAVPSADTVAAVNRALAGENLSQGALYFKSVRSGSDWSSKTLLFNYGNHNFYF